MRANLLLLVIGAFFGTGGGFLLGQAVEAPPPHDHTSHGAPHDDHGALEPMHDHDTRIENGAPASVSVTARPDGPGALNLRITPTGMTFAPEAVNAPHVTGQGHAHVYVNGVKQARVYGEWLHLDGLETGTATLRVTLNANSHEQLAHDGEAVETTQEVVVP